MKKTKVTLANVLLIVAAIGFGFGCYLSVNFLTLGDTKQSLIGAVIISLVLAGLAFAAQKFKTANRSFRTNIILEIVALLLFIGAAFIAVQPFSHVFTVFKQKEDVENKVIENLNQAQKMFDSYEDYATKRENTYKSTIKSVVAAKQVNPSEYKNYGFDNNRPDDKQIETKVFTLHAKLFPSNYKNDSIPKNGIKGAAINWLDKVKKNLKSDFGFTFGIVKILNEVPLKIKDWKTKLTDFSEFRAKGETAKNFDYPLNFNTVKKQLTKKGTPTLLSVVLALVAYMLMLLPYFVGIRSTKSPYSCLFRKKNSKSKDNGIDVYMNDKK